MCDRHGSMEGEEVGETAIYKVNMYVSGMQASKSVEYLYLSIFFSGLRLGIARLSWRLVCGRVFGSGGGCFRCRSGGFIAVAVG